MTSVMQSIANGVAALGSPLRREKFPNLNHDSFSADRMNLYRDFLRVRKDLSRSIEKVKKQDDAKACRR